MPKDTRDDPDGLAYQIRRLALMARRMPPAWDGAGISIPVMSPELGTLGRILPGKGFASAYDLNRLGITRKIRWVFEPTVVNYLIDFFRDSKFEEAEAAWRYAQRRHRATPVSFVRDPERGSITGAEGIFTQRMAGKAEDRKFVKTFGTMVATSWSTLWTAGGMPTAGVYTGTPGAAFDRTTNGAWSYGLSNPTSPDKKYLLLLGYTSTQAVQILQLVDLLVAIGNIATTVGSQTVNSAALTRYVDGKGVMVTGVVTTQLGATVGSMSMNSYTDQDGNAAQAGQTFATAGTTIVNRTIPNSGTFLGTDIPLAAGDYGVRAISTFNIATSPAAGVIALEMYFSLMFMPGAPANIWMEKPAHLGMLGLQELVTTAGGVIGCLSGYILPSTATAGSLVGNLVTVAG